MRIGYSTTICRMSDTNTVKNTDTNIMTITNTIKNTNTMKNTNSDIDFNKKPPVYIKELVLHILVHLDR